MKTLKNFSKKTLSLVLTMAMILSLVLSCITFTATADTTVADTSWYVGHENDSVFTISTAAELLGLSQLGANGVTFCDKTIRLGTDIDLNPGWNAFVYREGNTATFPEAPENVWQPIEVFAGTLDGQGHSIRGIYVAEHFTAARQMAGFIKDFNGHTADVGAHTNTPTIKNLIFENSTIIGYGNSQAGCVLGGIAAWAEGGVVIENVYANIHAWMINYSWSYVGGLVGRTGYEDAQNIIRNCVSEGSVGTIAGGALLRSGTFPSTSEAMNTAQIVAGCKYATVDNCLARGTIYYLEVSHHGYIYAAETTAGNNHFTNNYVGNVPYTNTPSGWVYVSHYNTSMPAPVGNMLHGSIQSFYENDPEGTVYTISNVKDFLYAAQLSQEGQTFSGKILRLTANIDLNPGWNLDITIGSDNKATLPEIPTVQFPGFKTFEGTLDGQNHTISGLFMMKELVSGGTNLGFIELLKGTVKDVKFNNGFIFAEPKDGVTDCKIAGIAARITGSNAKIENTYADINVWYRSFSWQRIAGIVGKVEAANVTLNNVVFEGTVGNMTPSNGVPSSTTGVYMSQLVADGGWKSTLTLIACAMRGTCYAASGVNTSKPVSSNDSAIKTNIATTPTVTPSGAYRKALADFNIWPTAVADTLTAGYELDCPSFAKYYQEITADNYIAYIQRLVLCGYTLQKTSFPDPGRRFDLLDNGYYTVYVSYIPGKNATNYRARVFVEPYGGDYDMQETATSSTNVCSAKLIQLNVDNWYSKSAGGMSYVIRLTNGEFIVVDGGYASEQEATNLYNVLQANNPNSGNPVIAGWFISHLHNDHYGCLTRFAKMYSNNVTVKGFYYNFPTKLVESSSDNIPAVTNIYDVELAMKAFSGAKLYGKVHSGMTIGFAGATAQILSTHEDVCQSYWNGTTITRNTFTDGNDTSTVVKFNIGSEKMVFLADARNGTSAAIMSTFSTSYINAKFVQVSHHGFGNSGDIALKDLYRTIAAQVYLWPQDVLLYNTNGTAKAYNDNSQTFYYLYYDQTSRPSNTYIKGLHSSVEVIPCYQNESLTLGSYVAGTTYAKNYWYSSSGANIKSVYNAKKNDTGRWDGAGAH